MELVFQETEEGTRRRRMLARGGYTNYRVRQTIEEQDWQLVAGKWSLFASAQAGTPDDPASPFVCWKPPLLCMVDTPGFSAWEGFGPDTRQVKIRSQMSDPAATAVWVQQNFRTWVEGEQVYYGGWVQASIKVQWHNSLRLDRTSPTSPWSASPENRIEHGPMELGSSRRL